MKHSSGDVPAHGKAVSVSRNASSSYPPAPTVEDSTDQELPGVKPNDTVIAVMGITGSGKTTFISHFSDTPLVIGYGLESCTQTVDIWPSTLPDGRKLFLVDTPGFDDTRKSDTDILRELANWLNVAYSSKIKLTGIIYLHRILDIRVGNAAMRNLRMFRKLCGERGLASVVLATTMWSMVDVKTGKSREAELQTRPDFWKSMIDNGSEVFRHDRDKESALEIINYLIYQRRPVTLDIQHDMVDKGIPLNRTSAGQEVITEAEHLVQKYKREIQELRQELAEAIAKNDEEGRIELRKIQEDYKKKAREVEDSMKKMQADKDQLRTQMNEEHRLERQRMETLIREQEQRLLAEEFRRDIMKEGHEKDLEIQALKMQMKLKDKYLQMYNASKCSVM